MASIAKKVDLDSMLAEHEATMAPLPTKTLLQQAHEIIHGDREQTYGDPGKNLRNIASYWSIHLSATTGVEIVLTPQDVCGMMILLKQARLANTPNHRDSLMDIAGYAGLQDLVS